MKKYVQPETAVLSGEWKYLLCDSLVGDAFDDFTGSDEIEW